MKFDLTYFLTAIVSLLVGSLGTGGLILLLLFFSPDQAEKWWSLILKGLLRLGIGAKGLHKRYVKHDFQSRVNTFVRNECAKIPGVDDRRVRLEYVESTSTTRESFLEGSSVVIRIREDDPQEKNFVHAVSLYVKHCLLFKAKRYISDPQGRATELYVTMKLLENQKPTVVDYFLNDHLHPSLEKKGKVADIFEDLAEVDKHKFFFPVYLRELNFLGQRVFGQKKESKIHDEVDALIQFLKKFVHREVGKEETDLDLDGSYCRFAVVIIGKPRKLLKAGTSPYVNFIRTKLLPAGYDTIYLLSLAENFGFLQEVANALSDDLEIFDADKFKTTLYYSGEERSRKVSLLVLRRKDAKLYIQRADSSVKESGHPHTTRGCE